jgi:hypothetical protein
MNAAAEASEPGVDRRALRRAEVEAQAYSRPVCLTGARGALTVGRFVVT